ncbi:hypothetical protein [Chromobacterium violaceum]|uniref:Uncharacterized protein n=2 Tax=Chromobacterium violaceum TaxID=536 RepID=A0A1R0MMZ8_CHRVL|nr:hypothetical protein [Chromobacterium violaceum]AAQ57894.1 hypothetical protein CV_0215 [Chromobacterium violaceum ATCC 12472]ATP27096.1 hypothetical protein CRN81_00950 [Chromobacterium violaceum]ATP31009.1 hypothetical protein CR207_00950 [Chromobacterium violaceum]KJH67729.1 hypothetical protein UF16_09620 [Chromobacterium violaceum]KMN49634.1 hypothetical protein VK93_10125 [Chromobacterium violaceum]
MKRYLIMLALGGLLAQQAALAQPFPGPGPGRHAEHRPSARACGDDQPCPDKRRLRNLRQREAARNGDIGFDPVQHQSSRLLPPPDGHVKSIPSRPNFWQDKRRQEQMQNQSD